MSALRKTASDAALRRAIGISHPTTICSTRLLSVRPGTAFPSLQPCHNTKCNVFLPFPVQQVGVLFKTSFWKSFLLSKFVFDLQKFILSLKNCFYFQAVCCSFQNRIAPGIAARWVNYAVQFKAELSTHPLGAYITTQQTEIFSVLWAEYNFSLSLLIISPLIMQNISSPSLSHPAHRLIIFPFSLHLVAIFTLYYTFSIQLSREIVTTGCLWGQK